MHQKFHHEELVEETKEAIVEAQETGKELPENIQKLVDFMEENGYTNIFSSQRDLNHSFIVVGEKH